MVSNLSPESGGRPRQDLSPYGCLFPRERSIQRFHTLEAIRNAVDLCARHLSSAQVEFTTAQENSTEDVRNNIHRARQNVNEALDALNPIKILVTLNPGQIIHTSNCIERTTVNIDAILRVSRRLIEAESTRHYAWALAALAKSCEETSSELTKSLHEPIRKAQQDLTEATGESGSIIA